jgi:hypothetical protein
MPFSTAPLQRPAQIHFQFLKQLIRKAGYVLAFLAGVLRGFLKSIWDAVSGIAELIYDILKSIVSLDLFSDIKALIGALKTLSGQGQGRHWRVGKCMGREAAV